MIIITLSSIALAAEDPVVEDSPSNAILNYFDYAFTGFFAMEMILKVIFIFFILAYFIVSCNILFFFKYIKQIELLF